MDPHPMESDSSSVKPMPDSVLEALQFEDVASDIGAAFMMTKAGVSGSSGTARDELFQEVRRQFARRQRGKADGSNKETAVVIEQGGSSGDGHSVKKKPDQETPMADEKDEPPPLPESGPPEEDPEEAPVQGNRIHISAWVPRSQRPKSKPPPPPITSQPSRLPTFGPFTQGLGNIHARVIQASIDEEELEEQPVSTSEMERAEEVEKEDGVAEEDVKEDEVEQGGIKTCIPPWMVCGLHGRFCKK